MKNYGAKLQPIPGHVIETHQSWCPGLAAVMAVGSSIIIFFNQMLWQKEAPSQGQLLLFCPNGG